MEGFKRRYDFTFVDEEPALTGYTHLGSTKSE